MANCSNCYDGCTEIVSDRCVKYTGIDVPFLGVKKGDSLSYLEQALITFLASTLDGSGIKITLSDSDYCTLVSQYLQDCEEVTALGLFKALVKAACDLQAQIDTIDSTLAILNADYTIDCLTGVTSSSDTHAIVQAVITKLCEVDADLVALAADVDTNYVKISDINGYIEAYLASQATATRYYTRMIPFGVVAYFGSLSPFNGSGAGIPGTEWEKIYLCNGQNGTPDLRGRVIVGAIAGVPGGALNPAVDPAANPTFNPNYALATTYGQNSVTLDVSQIPSHGHTTTVTDPGHTHTISPMSAGFEPAGSSQSFDAYTNADGTTTTSSSVTGVSVAVNNTGGGGAHANIQPGTGCYFVIYIP